MQRISYRGLSLQDPLYVNAKLFSSKKTLGGWKSNAASLGKSFLQGFLKFSHVFIQFQINSYYSICHQSHLQYKIDPQGMGLSVPSNFSSAVSVRQTFRPKTDSAIPDSLQAVLDELGARRSRIIELISTLDEMKHQNEKLLKDCSRAEKEKAVAVSAGEKIKDSFQSVDKKFIDLRDEVINLREIELKYKDLSRKHDELNLNYKKALSDGPKQNKTEEKKLKSLLETSKEEIERLEKRIERLRNQSPTMVALQKVFSSIMKFSNGNTPRHDTLNEEFAAVQRKYANILTENFPSHAKAIHAREVLVQGCIEYVRSSFLYGNFDCEVHFSSEVDKRLSQYLKAQSDNGFHIRRLSNTSIEVACPEKKDCVGPYGVLSCFIHAFPDKGASMRVYPTIAKITIEKQVKVAIIHETCKSSKPGGQAANVTETQVKSALTFNGHIIARANSQDTRSQHENKKRADQRVIDESLENEIRKLKVSPPQLERLDVSATDMSTLQCFFQPSTSFHSDLYLLGVLRKSHV